MQRQTANQRVLEHFEEVVRGGDGDGVEFFKNFIAVLRQLCALQTRNLALEEENAALKRRLVNSDHP